jgi:hypothetical protein
MQLSRCLFVTLALTSAPLLAEPVTRTANFDPTAGPNQYTVNFPPELSGEQIFLPIVGGSFTLETDAELGTARLVSWQQDISPISIFGMSTGPITVTMSEEEGSEGTYNPEDSTFSASATFLISFDDTELQQIGFVSPVALQGTEQGTISGVGSVGSIYMYLSGQGTFAGGFFSYTCRTTARFEYLLGENQAQPGDPNHDREFDLSDAVSILASLFAGDALECPEAGKVNSDDLMDLSDAVYLLNYLFTGGPAPPGEPVTCASF